MVKLNTDQAPVIELSDYGIVTYQDILTACRTGDLAFITALLEVPAATLHHQEDRTGFTPLHYAAAYNARRVVVALVNSGRCDVLAKDGLGRTAASLAYEVAGNAALGRYLLRKEYQKIDEANAPPPTVVAFKPRNR